MKKNVRRILLGQLGMNGDCLHVTVLARQIKQDYPGCYLTWAISSVCKSIIEENPFVDQIWEIPASNWNEIFVAWHHFEREANRRVALGEFDEVFLTQIYPRNGQNYDGTTRVSHYRGYPRPITVSLQNILRLRHEEVERVRQFAEQHQLSRYRHRILLKCKSSSQQSFVTPEYALHVAHGILNQIPDCSIILSSNIKIASQDDRIIDGSVLSLRENAELTKYCTLIIGCSSGITQVVLTDWAKPLPMIQLLSGATSVYASVVHDLEYWKQPTSHILEMTDCPPEKLIECIHVALTEGFPAARSRFHQQIPLDFTWYLYHLRSFIMPTSRAQSLLHTVRRYGLHSQLKTFIENELVPKINFPAAMPLNYQNCVNLLEGIIRSQGQEPLQTNLYIPKDSYKRMPLVSICIPVYNGEKYFEEALSSVLSQTYPNIEILVSDDSSTDSTVEIARSFQNKTSSDFLILLHRRYGLAENWNFCVSHAKGKYIKFLFQDDRLEPDCVEKMVNVAEQDEEIGIVFSPRGVLISGGAETNSAYIADYHNIKATCKSWSALGAIQSGQELLSDPELFENPINKIGEPSSILIRKEVFDKVGGFDAELCQLVDVEMWFRIMTRYKIGFVNETLSYFRQHGSQGTVQNSKSKDRILSDYKIFFESVFKDTNYPDKVRKQAYEKFEILNSLNLMFDEQSSISYNSIVFPSQNSELLKQLSDYVTLCRLGLLKESAISELRRIRHQMAIYWLSVPPDQLENIYLSKWGKGFQVIMGSNFRNEQLFENEQTFLQELINQLVRRSREAPNTVINYLLAAMLYLSAGRLKVENARNTLPVWLIGDYERFMEKQAEV